MVMTSPLLGLFYGKEDSKEFLNSLSGQDRQMQDPISLAKCGAK